MMDTFVALCVSYATHAPKVQAIPLYPLRAGCGKMIVSMNFF